VKTTLIPGVVMAVVSLYGLAPAVVAQDAETSGKTTSVSESRNTLVKMQSGRIVTPASSVPAAKQGTTLKTMFANTNLLVYMPDGWKPSEVAPPRPDQAPPFSGYGYETPASLACVYGLVTPAPANCNPNVVVTDPSGGKQTIAIVDAYDDPWAGPDLAYFSAQFGLPFSPEQFGVVYQSGTEPAIDQTGGWELEESLDIEYAHAMAPNAVIYLVEANSNSYADLFASVQIASNLVACGSITTCPATSKGRGEVSMSWGGREFPAETKSDTTIFATPGVVYFASSGDSPGVEYPCASPNVVCAGGTTFRRNPTTLDFIEERTWELAGGGASLYEARPPYQPSSIVGKARGVPDVSGDSNPVTGLWVWDSNYIEEEGGGWFIVGGTSAATPTWAGIVNNASAAGTFAANSAAELKEIYKNMSVAADYFDVTLGVCGPYAGYSAATGWDPCTGVGSPVGYAGK
jgi:kumamolisin